MGVKIGDYIHLHYEHYEKYGLNTRASGIEERPNPSAIFSKHHSEMMKKFRRFHNKNPKVKEELEKQLNYFFDLKKGNKIDADISDADLKNIEESILTFLGDKIKNVDIDTNKLNSAFNAGHIDMKDFSEDLKNTLKKSKKIGIGNKQYVQKSTIEERIITLIRLRDSILISSSNGFKNQSERDLVKKINKLTNQWFAMSDNITSLKVTGKGSRKNRNFIEDLNSIIPGVIGGPTSVHGEYAEALVVLMNYLATKGAIKGGADLLNILQQGVLGADRSKKGINLDLFDSSLVDVAMFQNSQMKLDNGVYFRTTETQDKVDVMLEFEGLKIPGSVKNYNMANPLTDVHLLSGSSILMLVQQYPLFLNHYLNIVAEHKDRESPSDILMLAHNEMKLTILLKALTGGVFAKDSTGNIGSTKSAQVFIVNDNSGASNDGYGKFSVYYIDDIIDVVAKDLSLLKTGDYDNIERLPNKIYYGEKGKETGFTDLSYADAKIRISNLLMQLHKKKLEVSIKKQVFSKLK